MALYQLQMGGKPTLAPPKLGHSHFLCVITHLAMISYLWPVPLTENIFYISVKKHGLSIALQGMSKLQEEHNSHKKEIKTNYTL